MSNDGLTPELFDPPDRLRDMARSKRILYPGALYHVMSRGNDKAPIVHGDLDRCLFVKTLSEAVEIHDLILHAWVLMENHFHLLVETPRANLSKAMKYLNGVYTQKFNHFHHRVGHLLQGRFKSILVDGDEYFLELCRYIVLNPVRAGLVPGPSFWKWGSYRATAGLETAPQWFVPTRALGLFHGDTRLKRGAYRRFVADGIGLEGPLLKKAACGAYLGGEAFLARIQELRSEEDAAGVRGPKPLVRPDPEKLVRLVAEVFAMEVTALLRTHARGNEARDVLFHLLREAGFNSREIGAYLGVSEAAVRNRWTVIQARLEREKGLAGKVDKCRMTA